MNTKLKCLLLDDELPGLTYLKMLCEQFPDIEVVKAFNNPQKFLQEVTNIDFDLCVLDIEMPGMNGLQVANLLNGKPVIFTTAYKEHAVEAFDLNAIDYVIKPIQKERLNQAIQKAKKYLSAKKKSSQFMQINTDKGKALIFFEQLCYIKASDIDSRDKVAQLTDGTSIMLKNTTFQKLQKLLPQNDFARVNKKEIIALKAIQVFSFDEITTTIYGSNGEKLKLTLSEIYRNEFLQKVKPF